MTENNFQMHFSPFQINTQLFFFRFFFKMAAGGHFGSPIWTILDDRKSLSIAFLAISDQYTTFFCFEFFFKMAASSHFGSPICAKNKFRTELDLIDFSEISGLNDPNEAYAKFIDLYKQPYDR